jgi:hypothetical protein
MLRTVAALSLAAWALAILPANADDWVAGKLRGAVVQLVDGQWPPLKRGMIVPDDRVVRTMAAGYVTFTRGGETLDLGPSTQIQIFDKGGKKPFTTVKEYFGTVAVEAEVRDVQHFAVETPYLAAVVKGTRFVVKSDTSGANVSVQRGHVAIEDKHDHSHVTLSVGQAASLGSTATDAIMVSGNGKLPPVFDVHEKPLPKNDKVSKDAQTAAEKSAKDAEKAAKYDQKAAEKAAKDAQMAADKGPKDAGSEKPAPKAPPAPNDPPPPKPKP